MKNKSMEFVVTGPDLDNPALNFYADDNKQSLATIEPVAVPPFDSFPMEMRAFRRRLIEFWSSDQQRASVTVAVEVRLTFREDGTLEKPPVVISRDTGPAFDRARAVAIRSITAGQPYKMLTPATYQKWRTLDIRLDPASR